MTKMLLILAAVFPGMLVLPTTAMGDDDTDIWSRGTHAFSNGQLEQAVVARSDALAQAQEDVDPAPPRSPQDKIIPRPRGPQHPGGPEPLPDPDPPLPHPGGPELLL